MIASAGPEQYRQCLSDLVDSDEVDAVIVIFIPTTPGALAEVQAAVQEVVDGREFDKTVLAVFMEADTDSRPRPVEEGVRIPTYPFPEPAAQALARSVRYAEWRGREQGQTVSFPDTQEDDARQVVGRALERLGPEGGWLDPADAEAVLDAYGIARATSRTAATRDEAVAAAREIGGPVVLKVVAPSALHKSDVGGIVLDVRGDEDVGAAFDRVTGVVGDAEGALVQEFVGGGHEVILGMTEDPSFGPLIAFGLGGVFVELIGDVAFRINPVTDVDVDEMIAEVKSARLLDGYRGGPAGDVPALKETLLRLSAMVEELPEIAEFDLNPVKVLEPGRGLKVVDLRMRVRPVSRRWLPSRKDIPSAELRTS
jgi:acyl-CoA synthetase (NDP forming)